MNVLIANEHPDTDINLKRHEQFVQEMMEAARESDAEVSITFVTDEAIQELNRNYRHTNAPTDVLSFSLREGESVGLAAPLGDIVISIDTAKRQAQEFGHTCSDEIDELLFHGFLHLLGGDHDGDNPELWYNGEEKLLESLKNNGASYIPKGLIQPNE